MPHFRYTEMMHPNNDALVDSPLNVAKWYTGAKRGGLDSFGFLHYGERHDF
jgi:hypothetical protein